MLRNKTPHYLPHWLNIELVWELLLAFWIYCQLSLVMRNEIWIFCNFLLWLQLIENYVCIIHYHLSSWVANLKIFFLKYLPLKLWQSCHLHIIYFHNKISNCSQLLKRLISQMFFTKMIDTSHQLSMNNKNIKGMTFWDSIFAN